MRHLKGSLSGLGVALLVAITATVSPAITNAGEFELKRMNPPTLNKHPAYSQVTTVTGDMKLVFIAGQVDRAVDYKPGSGACRNADWHNQYIGMNENVEKGLKAAGATWADVVYIRRFVVDMKSYIDLVRDRKNPVPRYWKRWQSPPSTLVEVVRLSEPCQLMETDVMAVVKSK